MIDTRTEDALPAISEESTASPENDFVPTPAGQARVYFDDQLMAWNQREFQLSFERAHVLDPNFILVDPPVSMWPDEDPGEIRVHLSMPDEEIGVREQSADSGTFEAYDEDSGEWVERPREREWVPENGEEYDFRVRLEVTPYEEIEK